MKPANFAPVYACLYPQLTEIARKHGYALATHGSMARDFDLVCIPWVTEPSDPQVVVDEITATFAIREKGKPETREHGRLVYTLAVKFGECFIDLSFMPTHPTAERLTAERRVLEIDYDADMDRYYIPVHPNWEIQTKGKGSSFRLANTVTGKRWMVTDKYLQAALEQMARDINAAPKVERPDHRKVLDGDKE